MLSYCYVSVIASAVKVAYAFGLLYADFPWNTQPAIMLPNMPSPNDYRSAHESCGIYNFLPQNTPVLLDQGQMTATTRHSKTHTYNHI